MKHQKHRIIAPMNDVEHKNFGIIKLRLSDSNPELYLTEKRSL